MLLARNPNARHPGRRDVLAAAGLFAAWPAWGQTTAPAPGAVRVNMVTGQGLIVLELVADRAPITTANFLHYVDTGLYDGESIYRAMRLSAQPPAGLVQGGARSEKARAVPPIAHESTRQTGLSHRDGTLSLARREPGTATSDFFICVGDLTSLDADPSASGDNVGFAAFGHVAQGMDVVRRILSLPTSPTLGAPEMAGQMLDPPIPIISARRIG
jgi:peptidyl-prolyl cis-trans isomerase A (cyclophilin A)